MTTYELALPQTGAAWSPLSAAWVRMWLLPAAVSFLIAIGFTAVLIRVAPKKGWVCLPRQDRWSVRVVAQFGGVPILLAFLIAAFCFFRTPQSLILLLLTGAMAALGLTDDVARLSPKTKLAGQVLLAGLAVYAGILHPLTHYFWVNAAFTAFWIVGITNAVNLLDNMDGLAGGVAIIAAAQVVLFTGPGSPIGGLALCMLAAVGGFLVFNINPARVFMGDVGALAIGFFLACASVKAAEHLSSLGSVLFVPSLVLFIPVFDTLLVSVTRRVGGRRISVGGRDHASHRLVLMGLSERQAVSLLYVIAGTAGLMAFLWKSSWGDLGAGIVSLFLIGSTLFWIYLAKLELPAAWVSAGDTNLVLVPQYLQQAVEGIFLFLLDAAVIILGLYFAYLVKFERLDRVLFGRFLFTAALALAIKLPLLVIFGAGEHKWAITRRRDAYPVLKAAVLAACLLTAASAALPKSKTIESSIILFDSIFTCVLLVLSRASGRIFDDLFGKQNFIDVTMKKLASWSRLRAPGGQRRDSPDTEPVLEKTQEKDSEVGRRPN